MAHDRRRFRRAAPDRTTGLQADDTVEFRPVDEISPVDQLDHWRTWRQDTAEFPAVVDAAAPRADQDLAPMSRRRFRPGAGLLIGGGLVAAALVLSGLAAVGVGPVRDLIGSGHSSGSDSSQQPSGGSGSSTSPGEQAEGNSRGTAGSGAGSTGTRPRDTTAPSAPTRAGGPPAPAERPGPGRTGRSNGQAGPGRGGSGRVGPGQPARGGAGAPPTPGSAPQPPAGGPGGGAAGPPA